MSQASFDLDMPEAGPRTYSVSELTDAINATLRRGFSDGVWIRGEIQAWNERGAHAYFRLVEDTREGKSVLNVSLFANMRVRLKPTLSKNSIRLGDGLKVRVFGRLDIYAPSGQLSLKMTDIDPRFTLGDLEAQRNALKQRLADEGLFDANRRTRLALVPLRLGVVTSVDSAAWADFQHELERSGLGFQVRVVNVRVQGDTAVPMVTRAVRALGQRDDLDVVVVIRGGGSRTDLATFDHEAIAVAIAKCPLPVFTGLGHEIDRSIADDVAHSALKTPTACAAALVEHVLAATERMESCWSSIQQRALRQLERSDAVVTEHEAAIRRRTVHAVDRGDERLARGVQRLRTGTERVTERAEARLAAVEAALARTPARLDGEQRHLEALAQQVRLLDPVNTMARGWSITRTIDGRTVRDAADVGPGDELITTFAAGSARSRVEESTP